MTTTHDTSIVIRRANAEDGPALRALAQLDGARLPDGDLIVAEAGGELRAALRVSDRAYVADPFYPSRELVGLLDVRAGLMRTRELTRWERVRTRFAQWGAMSERAAAARITP